MADFIKVVPGEGLKILQAKLVEARAMVLPLVTGGTSEVVDQGILELQTVTPIGEDLEDVYHPPPGDAPGHLVESYESGGVETTNVGAHGEILTKQPLKFKFVTEGTPTPILPKFKMFLYWQGADHPMARVRGQAANPFYKDAEEATLEAGKPIFLGVMHEIFAGL